MSTEPLSALERIRAADRALDDVALDPGADARIRSRLSAANGGRRRGRAGPFALLGAATAAIGLAVVLTRPLPADIPRCQPGPTPSRCVVAWAGSRIVVEPGGQVEVGSHSVRLLAGRARFDVRPRAPGARPYRVRIAGATVDVLGTAFTVRAYRDGGSVELHHGRIAVSAPSGRRTIVERPGGTLSWSAAPEPAKPVERPSPASPPARQPEPPPTPPSGRDRAEPGTPIRSSTQPTPDAAPRATSKRAAARARRSPATDAELARVVALRRDGRPGDALALVDRLARRANSPAMAEALSVERGDLLGGPLGERAAACAHWRRHVARFRRGPLRSAVDASVARLRCASP